MAETQFEHAVMVRGHFEGGDKAIPVADAEAAAALVAAIHLVQEYDLPPSTYGSWVVRREVRRSEWLSAPAVEVRS